MGSAVGKQDSPNRRIASKFAAARTSNHSTLIPFVVAGDPDLERTHELVLELEAQGADLIELGVPFSDPMADGPANQRAAARGLAAGASLPGILALVAELRKRSEIPIVLFGYFNPIFRYGCGRLCADAKRAGVDGLLVIDLPPEEAAELAAPAASEEVDLIYVLAPTTPLERSRIIAASATGFLYYVSVMGVTGARNVLAADLEEKVSALKGITQLPIGVGFGISTAEQANKVARFADAVVVGSAFSQLIELHAQSDELLAAVGEFASKLKQAVLTARTGT
jgi:tryptophan synthase alpha chain